MNSKTSMSGPARTRKALLLGSSSALVFAALTTGELRAADAFVALIGPSPTGPFFVSANGQVTGGTSQVNVSDVTGSISAGQADLVANTVTTGAVAGSTTVSVNTFSATATGNTQTTTSDTLGTTGAGDGLAIVATQINSSEQFGIDAVTGNPVPPAITSSVTSSTISATLNDFEVGSASVEDNTISTRTTGNTNTTEVSGVAPFTGSPTVGTFSGTSTTSDIDATVVVSTTNANINVGPGFGSFAAVADNSVSLLIQEDAAGADLTVTGSAVVDGNQLDSTFIGNDSTNSVNVETTSSPVYEGTIALANVSSNFVDLVPTSPDAAASSNTGSSVSGTIADGDGGSVTLQGALSVSDNTISSAVNGNQSSNAITVEDGQSIDGNALAVGSSTLNSDDNPTADLAADLLLINSQSNAGDNEEEPANLNAETTGGSITTSVSNIDQGSVSMSGDRISASTTGSTAENTIDAGGSATNSISATAAIGNMQFIDFAESNALLENNVISSTVGVAGIDLVASVTDASVSIDAATLAASAGGNDATNTLSLAGTTITPGTIPAGASLTIDRNDDDTHDAESSASAAVSINSNQRLSNDSDVQALNLGSAIGIDASGVTTDITGSSFAISGGSSAAIGATAVGNSVDNTLTLAGTSLEGQTAGIVNAQTVGPDSLDTDNDVLSVIQSPSISMVLGNDDFATDLVASSAEIGGNTVQAFSAGNQGTNAMDVTGTSSISFPTVTDFASEMTFDLTTLSGLIFDDSIAAQTQGAYSMLSSQANSGPTSAEIASDNAVVQITVGGTDNTDAPGNIELSSVAIDGNRLPATSLANQVGNTLDLSGNAIAPSAGYSPIAGITNLQEVGIGGSSAADINSASTGTLFAVTAGNDVLDSTVEISGNLAQAMSVGNYASENVLSVTGNQLSAGAIPLSGLTITGVNNGAPIGQVLADLPLTVVNVQSVATGAAITSEVNTAGTASAFGSGAVIDVRGDDVTNSTLALTNNAFIASATDNNALMNAVRIEGVNELSVGAGVQNLQFTAADAAATLGTAGTAGSPGTPPIDFGTLSLNVAAGSNSGTVSGNTLTISGNDAVINTSGLTPDEVAALQAFFGGGTIGAGTLTLPAGTYTVADGSRLPGTGTWYFSTAGAISEPLPLTTPGTAGTPATPSAASQIIAVNDPITNSSLSITADASTRASGAYATSNNATNVLDISANTIASGGVTGFGGVAIGVPEATVDGVTGEVLAEGDFALQNGQIVFNDGSIAEAHQSLGIVSFDPLLVPSDYGITGSSLLIDGNRLQAFSQGNIASNALSLEMTNTGDTAPSAALVSGQFVEIDAAQSASSDLQIFAPAVIGGLLDGEGSSSIVSSNANTALSVQNDVTNSLSVSGVNVGGVANGSVAYSGGFGTVITAQGAYSLNNTQDAQGAGTTATATTDIFNYDNILSSSSGIVNSTVGFIDNATVAESNVNRANVGGGNTMVIEAANLDAGGALVNAQTNNGSPSSASATSSVSVAVVGGSGVPAGIAATGSSIDVGGNTTTATARGNIASNSYTANAANNGTGATLERSQALLTSFDDLDLAVGGTDGSASNHALASAQINGGVIAATATGEASVSMTADIANTTQSVLNSSVALDGNNVRSEANGNVAGNTMTIGGTNLNAGGAVGNAQVNTASITSSATNAVSLAVNGGAVGLAATESSALNVTDNATVAVGRGNSANNALNASAAGSYGTQAAGAQAVVVAGNVVANAGYALLNAQSNSGAVSVGATASYTTSLNSDAIASAAVFDSGARVSGNRTAAIAYGNTGSNTMTVAALNTGPATTSLVSNQVNRGGIGATAVGANTLTVGGAGATGSSLGVNGNGIAAAAYGNSVANAILSR